MYAYVHHITSNWGIFSGYYTLVKLIIFSSIVLYVALQQNTVMHNLNSTLFHNLQANPDPKSVEDLMTRTFMFRRSMLENTEDFTIGSFLDTYPFLRQEVEVRLFYIRMYPFVYLFTSILVYVRNCGMAWCIESRARGRGAWSPQQNFSIPLNVNTSTTVVALCISPTRLCINNVLIKISS